MKHIYILTFLIPFFGFSQPSGVKGTTLNQTPIWENGAVKAQGDSCGTFFNNYIGLNKLVIIREESMRTGNVTASGQYNGRAQRFEAPQDIEVSGVEFFAYIKNNPTLDSIMVITALNEYDVILDSVTTELIRDTVYVTQHTFSTFIPNMSVKSYFNVPILVNTDYVVSIFTPTDDSLYIIANDPGTFSGNAENLGHALYDNVNYPSYQGSYSMYGGDAGGIYDYDFLIAPLIKYKLQDGFTLDNDTICPAIPSSACVDYTQQVIFANQQYSKNTSTPTSTISWLWGDNTLNTGLTSACHMYQNSGTYNLNLKDTLFNWDYDVTYCLVNIEKQVLVLDSVIADFTVINSYLTAEFTNTSNFEDSISWNFGDGTLEGNINTPSHTYPEINMTYDVWMYAYNDCTIDSIQYQIVIDNVGIMDFENIISIYPNPANQSVKISNLPNEATISLYNLLGELIKSEDLITNQTEINVQDITEGTYILKINYNQDSIVKKIVVQH